MTTTDVLARMRKAAAATLVAAALAAAVLTSGSQEAFAAPRIDVAARPVSAAPAAAPGASLDRTPLQEAAAACYRWAVRGFPALRNWWDWIPEYFTRTGREPDLAGGNDLGDPVYYGYEEVPEILDQGGQRDRALTVSQAHFEVNYESIATVRRMIENGTWHADPNQLAEAMMNEVRVFQGNRYIGNARCGG